MTDIPRTDQLRDFRIDMIELRLSSQIYFGSRVSDIMQDTNYRFNNLKHKTLDNVRWIEADDTVIGRDDGLRSHWVECRCLYYYPDGTIYKPDWD